MALPVGVWSWLSLWWHSRDHLLFLAGLPALLVGVAGVSLVALAATTTRQEVEGRYLDQARSAFKAGDYPAAMTCYDRLAYHSKERPDIKFELARTAAAMGQTRLALATMAGLAPPDKLGYAPAHLWMARFFRNQRNYTQAPEVLGLAEAHLLHALEGELEDPNEAHALLGEIYLIKRQFDLAEPHLNKAVRTRPEMRMRLAEMHALRHDPEAARREAGSVASYYRARVESDLKNIQARLILVNAVRFLEEFPQAVAILEEGLALDSESANRQIYRQALGEVYACWLQTLDRKADTSFDERLRLLDLGLNYDPCNPGLLKALFALTRKQGPEAAAARTALQKLLARGEASPMAHMALGLVAWENHKESEARLHLEAAYRLAPENPEVANNLAFILSQSSPPDLPRALELITLALRRYPENPTYRGTRGHIRLRMEKWEDARFDLEAALNADRKNPGHHADLAEAYAHLGDPDLAAEHRRLAQEERKPDLPPGP